MTHLVSQPIIRPGLFRRTRARGVAAALILTAASCSAPPPEKPEPPPVTVTDTRPVGEGLKVVGYALLGAAVVGVLGRLVR